MDIDQMPAGREMDEQVATKVMGSPGHHWVQGIGQVDMLGTYEGCAYCEQERKPEREMELCVRQYSIDIKDAWEVVEKLKLTLMPVSTGWMAWRNKVSESPVGEGNTVMLAICRAALKAVLSGKDLP